MSSGDWNEWRELVLSELAELKKGQDRLEEGQTLTRIDVAQLKVKAGLWGGLAGLVPGAIAVAVLLLGGSGTGAG